MAIVRSYGSGQPFPALWARHTVAQDFRIGQGVTPFPASVVRIALDGIDSPILDFLHNPHVVGFPIQAIRSPIEKDNITGAGFAASVLPQAAGFEPFLSRPHIGKFRDNVCVDIPALVGAPTHKAGAPLHTGVEAVLRPIGFAAYIADL